MLGCPYQCCSPAPSCAVGRRRVRHPASVEWRLLCSNMWALWPARKVCSLPAACMQDACNVMAASSGECQAQTPAVISLLPAGRLHLAWSLLLSLFRARSLSCRRPLHCPAPSCRHPRSHPLRRAQSSLPQQPLPSHSRHSTAPSCPALPCLERRPCRSARQASRHRRAARAGPQASHEIGHCAWQPVAG